MSETIDLTLLFNLVHGVDRELRLLRLQVDNMAPRLTVMEQSFHDLVTEVARGFGQMQQQMIRHEKQIEAVSAGLAGIANSNGRMEKMLAELLAKLTP